MSMSLEFLLLCVVFSMLQCYHANGEDYCRLHDLKALNVNLRALRTEYNDYNIEKEREFKKYKDETAKQLKASSKKLHDLDVKLNETIAELEWLRNNANTTSCTTTTQATTTAATAATTAQQTSTTTITTTTTPATTTTTTAATTAQQTTTATTTSTTTPATTTMESFCLNGWTRRNDSCYLFEDLTPKNWQQADQYCRDQDGHLVVIDSKEENTWLKLEIRKLHPATEDQFWTAGNDRSKEGTWVWGNSRDSIMTTYWYPGEPNQNGGDEDCVALYTRLNLAWNDEHCDKAFPFICEMDPLILVDRGGCFPLVSFQQYCRDQDGHLVVIDSKDENTWLQQEIRKLHPATEDQFWTDGNDRNNEGSWVWGHSNKSILTTFWYPGEPNQSGGNEDCLSFLMRYNLAWNDEHCDRLYPFICEMEDPQTSEIIG